MSEDAEKLRAIHDTLEARIKSLEIRVLILVVVVGYLFGWRISEWTAS